MVVEFALAAPAVFLLLLLAYLVVLAAAGFLPRRDLTVPPGICFGIIIPAHNEEEQIGETLAVLQNLDYPDELVEVVVVADSCSDATEEIVCRAGVRCLVRTETRGRGKGAVLAWAFERLLAEDRHQAWLVLDADSHPAPDFLQRLNAHFQSGARVVQGYSQVRHPARSVMESLAFLGFALNRNLRYRGRARLGLSSNLLGTGMCFEREILTRFGWETTTLVEDIEYTMHLLLHGVRVRFADDARLSVELHSRIDRSRGQRTRWDLGKFEVRNRYLPRLLKAGFRRRDPACFDGCMELLLPPFSLFCILVAVCCTGYFTLFCREIDTVAVLYLLLAGGLSGYILLGLLTAGAERRVYLALLHAPLFVLWRLWIVVRDGLRGGKERQW